MKQKWDTHESGRVLYLRRGNGETMKPLNKKVYNVPAEIRDGIFGRRSGIFRSTNIR
jgi:hypothetical protein